MLLQTNLPEWHVVEPLWGDIRGHTVIQNKAGKKVQVPISRKDVDDLSDDELLNRIVQAIS